MREATQSSSRRRSTCRLCSSRDLTLVLSLTPTPPANAFVAKEAVGQDQETYPLDVFFCEDCHHVQLLDVIDPGLLFEDYVYVSGTSPVFKAHFERYAKSLCERFKPLPGSLALDIGSNDGTLLGYFKEAGMSVVGVDPARDIARRASEGGIRTLAGFFTPQLARQILADHGQAGIITANNVFAHADDLAGILEGVKTLLPNDGVFVFEVSYLADVCEKTLFDTIYHEHLSYHSVKPLVRFLENNAMEAIGVERLDTHGGSIRVLAQNSGGPYPVDGSVGEAIALEKRLGHDRADTFQALEKRIVELKADLHDLLEGLKTEGKTIAGFGAPAKATTLMHQFGLDLETIDFIVDDSPLKQGLFSPGLHVPILPTQEVYERNPDYLLILAWNFAEPIMANHAAFHERGGRFIIPVPKVEIH